MPPLDPSTAPNPRLVAQYHRGKILRVEDFDESIGEANTDTAGAAGSDYAGLTARGITFQYNPETITRSRNGQWEPRARRNGRGSRGGIASPQELHARSSSGSAHLMAESETISLKVTFDATEQRMAGQGADGVLPELAFLENTSMGRSRNRRLGTTQSAQPVRPDELLLVLGPKRTFPVILTSLTITEQKFAPDLTPIRADADLRFNVLEPIDVSIRPWVQEAFQLVIDKRARLSRQVETGSAVDTALSGALNRPTTPAPGEASAGAARPANPSGGES